MIDYNPCQGCDFFNKPYWSIVSPCANCHKRITSGFVTTTITNVPSIEYAPVRHGRWIHTDLAAHWYGKDECSECTYHEKDRRDLSHLNYCPNCGCKMSKEE